jgi:hypothetical protein
MREIQVSLPWTIRYSQDFRSNPQPHKDFAHALVHVTKALGKLMALVDDMDHDRQVADDPRLRESHGRYLADLVVCAMRAANTFPGGVVDLEKAVRDRIQEKNPLAFPVSRVEASDGVESAADTALGQRILELMRKSDVGKYFDVNSVTTSLGLSMEMESSVRTALNRLFHDKKIEGNGQGWFKLA